ncbi:MAG: hypothetical protein EG826_18010 [Deltaproteobacteria bacterium]|nr:hypothetical protein [Deltaproteobacteria bacterium]
MSHCQKQQHQEYAAADRVFAGDRVPKPLRVLLRSLTIPSWTFVCYLAIRAVQLATLGRPEARKRASHRVAQRWISTMRGLFGIRMFFVGNMPKPPFFLVINHHAWVGYFGLHSVMNARTVTLDKSLFLPFVGILLRGIAPLPSNRKSDSVPAVNQELIAAIGRGESVIIAPEGRVSPGHMIRRYHAALLESAVVTATPVYYATVHWRTPEDCLPPSKSVFYGPDPYMVDDSGLLLASELEVWGPPRPLFLHLMHLLALPHCDMVIRFGPNPIAGKDRVSLAGELHKASLKIFTPSR